MENKWLFLLGFAIFFVSAVFSLIILENQKSETTLAPSQLVLEECKLLDSVSGQSDFSEDRINLLFFSDKKSSEEYADFFLSSGPFSGKKDSFNFFYIDNYSPYCRVYRDVAVLCHSNELIKKAASCPGVDYITVLDNSMGDEIRSSAYLNLMSLNQKHPKTVLLHEFGHVFTSLAEEYVPAPLPTGARNCVQECSDFQGDKDGCFDGCSLADYKRSVDNGVMRTLLSRDYGTFNEKIISEKISQVLQSKITGLAIKETNDCSSRNYYLIEGNYKEGEIDVISKTLESGCAPNLNSGIPAGSESSGILEYEVFSNQGRKIDSGTFDSVSFYTDVQKENSLSGEIYESDQSFLIATQKTQNPGDIRISENNQEILRVELNDIGARACRIN